MGNNAAHRYAKTALANFPQRDYPQEMQPRLFSSQVCLSAILRHAAVMLGALALCSMVACGRKNAPATNVHLGSDNILVTAQDGDLAKVKALLKANPKLVFSKDDKYGETPLHWAAYHGARNVAELLLSNKADVNAKLTDNDVTPLGLAALNNRADVAELLLANKADVNAKNKFGATPLQFATKKGYLQIADLLRQHGGQE